MGAVLIALACGMYHYCIKSQKGQSNPGDLHQNLIDSVAPQQEIASPSSAPKSPDVYPAALNTAAESQFDDDFKRLMANA